jgi:hypothetical protein
MRIRVLAGFLFALAGCGQSEPSRPTTQSLSKSAQEHGGDIARAAEAGEANAARAVGHARPAPGEPLELGYVPEDAFAVLVFNARRALQSQALAALPYEELLSGSLEAWNFDPREVEHWLLFFTPPVDGEPLDTPYSPGAVMRFVKPIDGQKLIATRGATKLVHLAGKPCYVQEVQPSTAFHMPDERTIVFAAEKQLEKILQPKASRQNALVELTGRSSREIDLHLAIDVEALSPLVSSLAAEPGQQPAAALLPYVRALDDVSLITATADLSGEQLLTAQIEARGPEAAQRLHQLARQSAPLVQVGYASLRAEILRAWMEEAAQGLLSVTDSMMARAAVRYEPTSIWLDISRPPQLDDLSRRLQVALKRSSSNR